MPSDTWGAIDVSDWRRTPVVSGRAATEQDVAEGRAAFYVPDGRSRPFHIPLPAPAIAREEGEGDPTPVIVIQAEQLDENTVAVGYRFLGGGNGVCTLPECEILSEPDARFA